MRQVRITSLALAALLTSLFVREAAAQHGLMLSGVGPVNRSMAGAATAAPLDAMGALYWNPATISGLDDNEIAFSLEVLYPQVGLSSTVPTPLGPYSGDDRSESGAFPLPAFGIVMRPADSNVTYGLGVFAVGGFGTNFPGNPGNPLLSPPPPNGVGVGPIYSEYSVLQIVPTTSWQLTDRLSVGLAPVISMANLALDPMVVVSPDDANGNGVPTYPSGTHTRYHWGMGFQLGAYYVTDACWNFGVTFKSPTWFETLRYHSNDEAGAPRELRFGFDFPMSVSVGTSYVGFDRWTIACDVRYIDYRNTKGYTTTGFDATGAVTGLGWDSMIATCVGAAYDMTDYLTLRGGYSYNSNPIDPQNTFFSVAAPLVIQHALYMGASYNLTCSAQVSLAYALMFENSSSGPLYGPAPIPGSDVTVRTSGDSLIAGVSVKF